MRQLAQVLRAHLLLEGLPDYEIRALAARVEQIELTPGDILCKQDQPSTACYLVVSGELEAYAVDSERGAPQQGGFYPNDAIGDVAVLQGAPYNATVRAVARSEVIAVPARDFRRLVGRYPFMRDHLAHKTPQEATNNFLFTLPNLRPDEQIIEEGRKHWIVVVQAALLPMGLLLLLVTLAAAAIAYEPAWLFSLSRGWRIGITVILMLVLTAWSIWEYLDWLNDLHIVTTHRIIHIQKVAFVFEERHETPIEKIQDVSLQKHNPLNELLNYGDLVIRTASQNGQIVFHYVPHPAELQRHILAVKNNFASRMKRREEYEKRKTIKQALSPSSETVEAEDTPADEIQPALPRRSLLERFTSYANLVSLREERANGALLWRKHWIILLGEIKWVLGYLFLLFAGIVLALVYLQRDPTPLVSPVALVFTVVLLGILGAVWFFWIYDDWRNDVYILTRDAVVDEEKLPLGFEKQVRRAPLDTIQDIQYEIPNPIYTVLDVGDVLIQTASVEGQLTFYSVHKPREIMRLIYERLRARREARRAREQQRRDEAVAEMLVLYEELKEQHSQQSRAG